MLFERSELRRPPVREVAAGFQYEPKISYSLVAGRLEPRFRERLTTFEENPNGIVIASEVGEAIGPLGRFSGGPWVVQTGQGVVTINGVVPGESYNFGDFDEFVRFVLRAYSDAGIMDGIQDASLRYINFIAAADTDPIEHPFRAHWSFPPGTSERVRLVRLSFSMAFADEVPVRVVLHHHHKFNDATGTLLDLSTQDSSPGDPAEWLRKAHDRVYQCFRHVLSDELHSKLEKSER